MIHMNTQPKWELTCSLQRHFRDEEAETSNEVSSHCHTPHL